jgi:hypothetical protein
MRKIKPVSFRKRVRLDFEMLRYLREKTLCRVVWHWPDGSMCAALTLNPSEHLRWLSTVPASRIQVRPAIVYGVK